MGLFRVGRRAATRYELSRQPGPRILVVDDEARIRRFLCLALEQNAWEAIDAADGPQAVDRVRETDPDLILLDINLPGMDGFEVLRRIREISAAPVIMLTGRDSEEDRVRGLDLGAEDYIVKPFGVREMIACVGANLRRADARSEFPPTLDFGDLVI
jgi:DNA-binding response OmpR family regulator